MGVSLGKIGGIPITLDYSWFVVFFLLIWSIGFGLMPTEYARLSTAEYLAIGVVASILLFVSILIHELAHSLVARRSGLKIRRITLFLFGGVSEMAEEPSSPSLELRMSLAGPATSLALTVFLFALWQISILGNANVLIQAPLNYGALVNGIVAAFNMIPAFPLDGGRALRSLIWRRNRDLIRSTEMSAQIASVISYGMAFFGIFLVFSVDIVTGLWFIIIGWFILSGAQSELRGMMVQEELGRLHARDVMTRRVDSVAPDLTLVELQENFLSSKHNGFPVISGNELLGCVTAGDLKKVRKTEWQTRSVREIMTPRESLTVISEDEVATKAAELMGTKSIGRVFVLDKDGRLSGIITRSDVIRTVQLQQVALQRGGAMTGGSFTVERGMDFILEQPTFGEGQWKATCEGDRVSLLAVRSSKHMDGREYTQFVFEALKAGITPISLVLESASPQGKPRASRTVRYTVSVMEVPASQPGQPRAGLEGPLPPSR